MIQRTILCLLGATLVAVAEAQDDGRTATATDDALTRIALGIAVQEMPNQPRGGVTVRHVTKDGPAGKAGMAVGDFIVRVANRPVNDYDDLVAILAGHAPGEPVTFLVLRDGEPMQLKVTLGTPPKRSD